MARQTNMETKIEPKIKYRRHNWLDTKSGQPKYGIQAKPIGVETRWLHCAEDGKPLIFDSEGERDAKLKEVRRSKRAA